MEHNAKRRIGARPSPSLMGVEFHPEFQGLRGFVWVEQHQTDNRPSAPVVSVRKSPLPPGGALPSHLADHLDDWAKHSPDPYDGLPLALT